MTQLELSPKEPTEQPIKVEDICPKCGKPRDKMLAKLMQTILRLRARLAEVDPGGPPL